MKKWIAIVLLILIVVIGYNYIYQNHRNISAEVPDFALNATTIKNEFASNELASEKKYLNTTVVITGIITEITDKNVTLNSSVFCQFIGPQESPLNKDSKIKVKGRVIGYDDLLQQVKLDQCTIIN